MDRLRISCVCWFADKRPTTTASCPRTLASWGSKLFLRAYRSITIFLYLPLSSFIFRRMDAKGKSSPYLQFQPRQQRTREMKYQHPRSALSSPSRSVVVPVTRDLPAGRGPILPELSQARNLDKPSEVHTQSNDWTPHLQRYITHYSDESEHPPAPTHRRP